MQLSSQYAGVDREAIWAALFAWFQLKLLTSNGGPLITVGRKHVHPNALPQDSQPAMFVVQLREKRMGQKQGTPNKLELHGYLIFYTPAPSTDEIPGQETQLAATTLNTFFKAVDDAMVPDNVRTGKFTIGGLVTECVIEGEVDQDPGLFGTQAAAILPVRILVP